MTLRTILVIASSVVGVACFLPYIRDVFLKKSTPHSYTWLIWTILQSTAVVAMLRSGAGGGALSLAIGAGLCGFIFLLSLRYGTKNITRFDRACFIGALLAIAVYLFLRNGLLSVIIVTLTDLTGFLPTMRKAYVEPHSETESTYFLSALSSALALGALSAFNATTALYLISLVITNSTCGIIIFTRRRIKA